MYIKIENGVAKTYSINQLLQDNPTVSFPENLTNSVLASWNVFPVKQTTKPPYNNKTHYLRTTEPEQINDEWVITYIVEPLPSLQVQKAVREERNSLLASTDWIVTKCYEEQTITPREWVKYRQALRDITNQPGFPFEIVWPIMPQ